MVGFGKAHTTKEKF